MCIRDRSYGQKHIKEIEAAAAITKYYGTERIELDLSLIFQYSDCSLLKNSEQNIPHESYSEQLKKTNGSTVSTYVPFRNGLFLASAASIALSKKCGIIYYGAHADDSAGNAYPDCSEAFNNAMNTAIDVYKRQLSEIILQNEVEPILRSRLQQEYLFRLLRGRVISVLKMKHLIGVH